MGGGGGERVRTETNQQPPQIAKEAKEGFKDAQKFFRGQLADPAIYGGERLAPVTDTQREALGQSRAIFGDPSLDIANYGHLGATAQGRYLTGPEAQEAVSSLSAPIFHDFQSRVQPGLRDESQFAGSGIQGSRRGIAEQYATEKLGGDLAKYAFAPIFTGERERMLEASRLIPAAYAGTGLRLNALGAGGAQERAFSQEALDMLREIFEEPLFRQSEAGSALLGSGVFGPGSSSGSSTLTRQLSTIQQIQQYASLLQSVVSIAGGIAGFGSSAKELKDDIVDVDKDLREIITNGILTAPVSTWRYKWERSSAIHVGPMLEDLPEMLRDPMNPQKMDIVSMFGALIITLQEQNKRIEKLEKAEGKNAIPSA